MISRGISIELLTANSSAINAGVDDGAMRRPRRRKWVALLREAKTSWYDDKIQEYARLLAARHSVGDSNMPAWVHHVYQVVDTLVLLCPPHRIHSTNQRHRLYADMSHRWNRNPGQVGYDSDDGETSSKIG